MLGSIIAFDTIDFLFKGNFDTNNNFKVFIAPHPFVSFFPLDIFPLILQIFYNIQLPRNQNSNFRYQI